MTARSAIQCSLSGGVVLLGGTAFVACLAMPAALGQPPAAATATTPADAERVFYFGFEKPKVTPAWLQTSWMKVLRVPVE